MMIWTGRNNVLQQTLCQRNGRRESPTHHPHPGSKGRDLSLLYLPFQSQEREIRNKARLDQQTPKGKLYKKRSENLNVEPTYQMLNPSPSSFSFPSFRFSFHSSSFSEEKRNNLKFAPSWHVIVSFSLQVCHALQLVNIQKTFTYSKHTLPFCRFSFRSFSLSSLFSLPCLYRQPTRQKDQKCYTSPSVVTDLMPSCKLFF